MSWKCRTRAELDQVLHSIPASKALDDLQDYIEELEEEYKAVCDKYERLLARMKDDI